MPFDQRELFKICILRDDDEIVCLGVLPNLNIVCYLQTYQDNLSRLWVGGEQKRNQSSRQVLIKQQLHQTATE